MQDLYTADTARQYGYYIYQNLIHSLLLRKQERVRPLPEKGASLLFWGISIIIGGEFSPANGEALLSALDALDSPLFLYYPDEPWRAFLQSRLKERLKNSRLHVYRFSHEDIVPSQEDCPCIVPVTRDFMEKDRPNTHLITDELYSYTDREDYYESGLGVALVMDGAVAGYCLSEYSLDNSLGVNIWIDESCRGRGYAKKMVYAFLQHCHTKGQDAYWVCDADNLLSNKVARSCGFTLQSQLDYFVI